MRDLSKPDKNADSQERYRLPLERSTVLITYKGSSAASPRAWVLLLIMCACAGPAARPAPFRARPDSTRAGDLRGPLAGKVVEAESGRPIAGALVTTTWSFAEGAVFPSAAGRRERVTTTDASGAYKVPRLDGGPGDRIVGLTVVVYKKGFRAYRSDRLWDGGTRLDFAQENHVVALDRWTPDTSHVAHLAFAGGGLALAALTSWELAEAAAELDGRPSPTAAKPGPLEVAPAGARPEVDAMKLLTPDDVKSATGFQGEFEARELGDDPTSASYSSLHLRARGQGEAYDLALRVWQLDPAAAQRHYGELLKDLPSVNERNELGDRSFRALSEGKDIFGMGWLDGRRGVVVLMTCGASQCRSHEVLLNLARTVKDRADQVQITPAGQP